MNTASSGLDETTKTSIVKNKKGRWRNRRRSLLGAVMAVATAAAATVVVVGGGVDSAEAQFGAEPPPATDTLCETDLPSFADYQLGNNTLAWGSPVTVPIDVFEVQGDATLPDIPPTGAPAGQEMNYFGGRAAYSGDFTYSVVLDNTGDPFDPDVNNHPSYHPMASSSPIVLTGAGSGGSVSLDLPAGCRYMMSVRAAGHDLGGAWIRIEADGSVQKNEVDLTTNDRLPMARVVVQAFHDFAQVNSQFDIGETGLEGFDVFIGDGGERAVDYFGNPICTNYVTGGDGVLDEGDYVDGGPVIDAGDAGGNCLTGPDGVVTIEYVTAGKYEIIVVPPDDTDWIQTTTIEGTHIIDVWIEPGDLGIGGEFIGDIDAATFQAVGFISTEIYPDPAIDYQYPYDDTNAAGVGTGYGDLTGCFFNGQLYPTADGITTLVQNGEENLDGTKEPMVDTYVALNDVGVHDSMMAVTETDASGCFTFAGVPDGSYQLAVFDYELLYIIGFYNVTVDDTTKTAPGEVVDMGDNFVLRWFGWSSGYVFYDSGIAADGTPIPFTKDGSTSTAANGVRDCVGQATANGVPDTNFVYDDAPVSTCEAGIPLQDVLIRNRDGQIMKAGVTDGNGYYEISNIWSLMFRMQVIEVGAGSLDITGHSVHNQFDRNIVASQGNCESVVEEPWIPAAPGESCLTADLGGGLLLASIFQQGKRNEIDFGKLSYLDQNAPNGFWQPEGDGHGGIAGGVFQTTTRAEWAGRKQGVEDNETGVPSTTVNLWSFTPGCADVDPVSGLSGADNTACYTTLEQSLETDSYEHPGASRNGQTCTIPTFDGTEFGVINPTFDPLGEECVGSWLLGSHTKDGAWNGGFAFTGMDFGFYVVEVVPPAGYQIVKENDLNTAEGNEYVPALPTSGCVGEYHYAQLDEDYLSPFDAFDAAGNYTGQAPVRLCDKRLVRVQPFRNAGVDMQVMTNDMATPFVSNFDAAEFGIVDPVDPYDEALLGADQAWHSTETVPMPGRFFGLVLDDLTMTANQNSLTFGEQQGAAYVPIGFYDHTGNHVTTIWTDENGHYEALLPSTFSINRATPGGVGPQMYEVVINDPGPLAPDAINWGYDGTYITNPNILDTWPGNMTKADTPVLSLAAGPCSLPTATPQLFEVDQVWADDDNLPEAWTIYGINLGTLPAGTLDPVADLELVPVDVTLGGVTIDPVDITVTLRSAIDSPNNLYSEMVIDLAEYEGDFTPGPQQLSFGQGAAPVDSPTNTITFHVLGAGYDLSVTTAAARVGAHDKVIQDAIEAAVPGPDGSLVVVRTGTYRESVVVHDSMVIQGHGSGGIVGVPTEQGPILQVETPFAQFTGSVVSPYGALLDNNMFGPWETLVASLTWDGNQNVEVGPAFQFLMTDTGAHTNFQLDGFGITGGRAQNGAVHVNGHADDLVISNMAIQANNASEGGAGINLGVHSSAYFDDIGTGGSFGRINGRVVPVPGGPLEPTTGSSFADNDDLVIRDNRILQNGGTSLAGGVGIFNGNNDYVFHDNSVCGNYSAEYGGGLSQTGSATGTIADNTFESNESFDEGGSIFIGGEISAASPLGSGIGGVTIERNQVFHNLSGDDGGGIMVLHALDDEINIVNNFIGNNVATDLGGGVHLANAGNANVSHNTIANNLSTNSAEDAGGFACGGASCARAGGFTTQPHSVLYVPADAGDPGFSDPVLLNNIFWNNQSGFVQAGVAGDEGNIVQIAAGVPDIGVYEGTVDMAPGMLLSPENSTLTEVYAGGTNNIFGVDPLFVLDLPIEIQSQAAPQLGQLANITIVFPAVTPIEASNYHLASAASPAVDLASVGVTDFDIDGELRDLADPDSGADEFGAGGGGPVPLSALMVFSTTWGNNGGILDHDAQQWTFTGDSTILDHNGPGGIGNPPGNADIDGIHAVSDTEFYVSFLGNNVELWNDANASATPDLTNVDDEDIVSYNSVTGIWALVVDGSQFGLNGGSRDIDALHRMDNGDFLVSFAGIGENNPNGDIRGQVTLPHINGSIIVQDEDIVRMTPHPLNGFVSGTTFELYFSGASIGLNEDGGTGDIDGLALMDGESTLLISTKGSNEIGSLGQVPDEDVVACINVTPAGVGGFPDLVDCDPPTGDEATVYFDGSTHSLAPGNDVNAVSGPLAN